MPTGNLIIRKPAPHDVKHISEAYIASTASMIAIEHPLGYARFKKSVTPSDVEQRFKDPQSSNGSSISLVAEINRAVIGLAALSLITGEIEGLFVHPNNWKAGIGSSLIAELEKAAVAAELKSIYAVTPQRNVSFFIRHGFTIEKTDKKIFVSFISTDRNFLLESVRVRKALIP